MKNVFITGADRGVGSGLVKVFLKEGWQVYAGQFMPEWNELEEIKMNYNENLHIIPLDVSNDGSVINAFKKVSEITEHLDMLINNAGIAGGIGDIYNPQDLQKGLRIFNTNCLGALRMTNTFLPLLEKNNGLKRLCYVSSEAGCVSICHRQDGFVYPMSKTALNMAVKLLFHELYPRGFTFRMYHPGWVRSYMSGKKNVHGKVEPEETAEAALRHFISDVQNEDVLRIIDNESVIWPF